MEAHARSLRGSCVSKGGESETFGHLSRVAEQSSDELSFGNISTRFGRTVSDGNLINVFFRNNSYFGVRTLILSHRGKWKLRQTGEARQAFFSPSESRKDPRISISSFAFVERMQRGRPGDSWNRSGRPQPGRFDVGLASGRLFSKLIFPHFIRSVIILSRLNLLSINRF